jgi:hypothetical protein
MLPAFFRVMSTGVFFPEERVCTVRGRDAVVPFAGALQLADAAAVRNAWQTGPVGAKLQNATFVFVGALINNKP